VKDFCRISEAVFPNWKLRRGGLPRSRRNGCERWKLRNRRLKLYADLSLDRMALKSVIQKKLHGLAGRGPETW
jgi:hypothetical protein